MVVALAIASWIVNERTTVFWAMMRRERSAKYGYDGEGSVWMVGISPVWLKILDDNSVAS